MERIRYSGVYPVLYTYRDENGRPDKEALRRQIESCIAAGADGIMILGLVTEVFRLSTEERMEIVKWTLEIVAGRVPVAVTVAEQTTYGQIDFCRESTRLGATWLILQPPTLKGATESQLVKFLATVADACTVPVAIQNNPISMDVSLSDASLLDLHRNHPNISLMKAEGAALAVAEFARVTAGTCDIFAGHSGVEYMTNLRSGCAGLIPAPELLDVQLKIHQLWKEGSEGSREKAEALHRAVLPVIVLMSRGLSYQLLYGKILMAKRIGLDPVRTTPPEPLPTEFGLKEIGHFFDMLGPLNAAGQGLSPKVLKAAGISL